MRLGVVFPQTEIGSDPSVIRDYAQAAESAGYDHLLVFDHVLGGKLERFDKLGRRPPYTERAPSTRSSFCSATSAPALSASSWSPASSSCPSARLRWWPSRPRRWTSSPAGACDSAWASAGIMSSTRP